MRQRFLTYILAFFDVDSHRIVAPVHISFELVQEYSIHLHIHIIFFAKKRILLERECLYGDIDEWN